MKHQLIVLLVACALCLLAAPARAQQEFSSESGSWTFTMPAGWQPMSKEMVTRIAKEYKVRDPEHPAKVVAGFIKSGGLFAYPQVVLQVCEADMSKLSWEGLERMCKAGEDESDGAPTAAIIGDLVYSAGAEDENAVQLSRGARTISATGTLVLDDMAEVQTASRAFLHSGGVVQLSCLERKENPGGAQKFLDPFANSFKVNAGHEFTPAADTKASRRQQVSYSPGMARYGMFGGGFVGLGVIALIIRIAIRAWANGD